MRASKLLAFAASCCIVGAEWFRWSAGDEYVLSAMPQETGIASARAEVGWTPMPTPAPGAAEPEGNRVLNVLLQREETTTNWTNSETCGWFSGVSSESFACGTSASCVTNSDHIVACASGTYSPFFSVCLDYAAFQRSSCNNDGTETGCCMDSKYGACETMFWTGHPVRSMYRCASSSTMVTMLDEPQFVIDASLLSASLASASATPTTTDHVIATGGTPPGNTEEPVRPTVNIGALVGGVLGGTMLILASAFIYFRYRRRRSTAAKKDRRKLQARLDDAFRYAQTIDSGTPDDSTTNAGSTPAPYVNTRYHGRAASSPTPLGGGGANNNNNNRGNGNGGGNNDDGEAPTNTTTFVRIPIRRPPPTHQRPSSSSARSPPSYNWILHGLPSHGDVGTNSNRTNSATHSFYATQPTTTTTSGGRKASNGGKTTPPPRYSTSNPFARNLFSAASSSLASPSPSDGSLVQITPPFFESYELAEGVGRGIGGAGRGGGGLRWNHDSGSSVASGSDDDDDDGRSTEWQTETMSAATYEYDTK
ncbi:uncharacterized protein GGS25DRAFT_521880 [Hypoxylon fragiforme]|uniref:uncharacterized protein n=1 Tax=Hypoxylon fragiforme TaxID=63214 RepID=UPI0020C685B5|nr:uncharacterized protein GGS25DRAFT_521880 [Hypoxylon fragiforme]KAI2608708.1 hypothetical protein GGS25DRAFT_521880 [Hypoxylon fragiforme]